MDCKPIIGTMNDWNKHYDNFRKNLNIRSKYSSNGSSPKPSFYVNYNNLMHPYQSFINDNNLLLKSKSLTPKKTSSID